MLNGVEYIGSFILRVGKGTLFPSASMGRKCSMDIVSSIEELMEMFFVPMKIRLFSGVKCWSVEWTWS